MLPTTKKQTALKINTILVQVTISVVFSFHETGISLRGVFLSEVFGISLGGGISLRKAWYFAQSGISLKKTTTNRGEFV